MPGKAWYRSFLAGVAPMLMLMKGSSGGIAVIRPTPRDRLVADSRRRWKVPVLRAAVIGGGALLTLSLFWGLHGIGRDGVVPLAGALAVAGLLVGMRLHLKRESPRSLQWSGPWWLLAAGIAVLAATSAGTSAFPSSTGFTALAAVGAYPFLGLGLLRLLTARLPHRSADVLAQAGMVATVVGFGFAAVLAPDWHDRVASPYALSILVLPALDAALLVIAVRVLVLPGDRLFVSRAVVLAVSYLLGAHLAAAMGTFSAWEVPDGVVRVLLVCSFTFWAAGALDPSIRRLADPLAEDPPTFSTIHFVLIEVGMLATPILVALCAQRGTVITAGAAIAAGLVSGVLAAYVGHLLWQRGALERSALHDPLTGLANRTLFADRVARAIAHARRHELPVAVLLVDLDHFKKVNDSLGHTAGDVLLREVARRLQANVREEDTVARLGGDEFAVLLPHITGIEAAAFVSERLLATFAAPLIIAEQQIMVTASIGLSLYPNDGPDLEALIEGADAAMYRAKEQGRNKVEIFSPALLTQAHERLALESALRHAVDSNELVLHYQPKVDLRSGGICGAEALVRWNHPEKGLLFPGHFVPLAEQSGLMVTMGEYVIAAALEQVQKWRAAGLPPLVMSVNISARQLRSGLADYIARALRMTGVDPRSFELELTESAAVESLDVTAAELNELRAVGVRCSIDDFGTGYCGLSYLSRLPIDVLKIDKSFIHAMTVADASIVKAIIALGHSLGLRVVAEGVETPEQLAYLAERGCDEVQGYLFSKPVPAHEFTRLLIEHVPGGPGRLPTRTGPTADNSLQVIDTRTAPVPF
jgi:diguanylate cyclase (GGDEF)-like protein